MGTPLPTFDGLVRDGIQRYYQKSSSSSLQQQQNQQQQQQQGSTHNNSSHNNIVPAPTIRTVSDAALGFRCVFGHLI